LPLPEDWVTLIDGILATAVLLDLALNRRPGVVEGRPRPARRKVTPRTIGKT
jgi:hypothetical protein